jgi:8-oxo-dGTP pyrophosphatase MutT (NUDIX family)
MKAIPTTRIAVTLTAEQSPGQPASDEVHGLYDSCVETLRGWRPHSAEQDRLRSAYLDHLAGHPDGWSRNCSGAHLTASSLICQPETGFVLLTLHARIGRWLQTGGHIEATDSRLLAAALREATEESGLPELTVDPTPLLLSRHEVECGTVRPTFHLDVQFLVTAAEAILPTVGPESLDLRWFGHDQLPTTDGSVRDLVAAAAGRLGW